MTARYRVEFARSAAKELDSLPPRIRAQVLDATTLLAHNPFSDLLRIKKLKGTPSLYRVRLGDYRLVYTVQRDRLVVIVIRIGHRRDVYRVVRRH